MRLCHLLAVWPLKKLKGSHTVIMFPLFPLRHSLLLFILAAGFPDLSFPIKVLAGDANSRERNVEGNPPATKGNTWVLMNSFASIKVRKVDWTELIEFRFLTFSMLKSLFCAHSGSLKPPWRLCCIPEGNISCCF